MDLLVFLAALASAGLHAAWNAAVKSTPDGEGAMAAIIVLAGVLAAPLLLVVPFPAPASWPFLLTAVVFSNITLRLLNMAYRRGAFAIAYPIARGAAPLVVALLGIVLIGDPLASGALAGMVLITLGVAVLALRARAEGSAAAVALALASALGLAGVTLGDATGVRVSGSLLGYGVVVGILNAAVFALRPGAGGRGIGPVLRQHAGRAVLAAAASNVSYYLILYAYSYGPVGPVAALRETSVVFATLLATVWLREPVGGVRWAAVALVAAGAIVLRLV